MKRITYYIMPLALACMALSSCQDVDEPVATSFEVKTLSVDDLSGRKASFTGSVSTNADCYFLVAQTANFTDADTITATTTRNESSTSYSCTADCSGLKPGKTYYVCLCATDGRSYVNSNSLTFTTPTYLEISNVYLTDIDGYTTSSYKPTDVLGVFVLTSWSSSYSVLGTYYNMQVAYEDSEFALPYDISLDSDVRVYAYSPYSSAFNGLTIPVYANESLYNTTTPTYLYGNSNTVNGDDTSANITLHYALAKVTLQITNASSEAATLSNVTLSNSDGNYIASSGNMNVFTGAISDLDNYEDQSVSLDQTIASGSYYSVDLMLIPTSFGENNVIAKVTIGGKQLSISLPTATWSKSSHYTYQISADKDALSLSGIRIEQWDNNNGGEIDINQN